MHGGGRMAWRPSRRASKIRRMRRAVTMGALGWVLAACQLAPPQAPAASPEPSGSPALRVEPAPPGARAKVLVLGIAQDAGVPQANDRCANCRRARRDPAARHFVASLALMDLEGRKTWLIDATPDIVHQLGMLESDPDLPLEPGRTPLAGLLLTHAHMGHYLGLAHFGREAMASRELPVYASRRMQGFLRANGPWSQLVELGHIRLMELVPGVAIELGSLSVVPLSVPHRDELSDTLGFLVRGPEKTLLYVPDIDKWHKWDHDLAALLREVDWALVDGTFQSAAELPDRDLSEIPHPVVQETLEAAGDEARGKLHFIHLNHSSPLLDPSSQALRALRERGVDVAREGQIFPL